MCRGFLFDAIKTAFSLFCLSGGYYFGITAPLSGFVA
jgi:hypothetical protein